MAQRLQLARRFTPAEPGLAPAAALTLAGCLLVAFEARRSTFSGDDWTFIIQRRGLTLDVFLKPHNEHLSALPVLAFKLLLATFGASSYVPFVGLLLILHGATCLLLFALARRSVGPWAALVPTAILVVLGPAWQDLLWAFQIGYLGSVSAGLGMLLCLERDDRRHDVLAGVLLGLSLLCSSIGLGMVILGAMRLLLARPREWRRLWAVAVPLALYLVWYAVYGVSTIRWDNARRVPHFVFDAFSAALASVTGLAQTHISPFLVSTRFGHFLAVAVIMAALVSLARGWRPSGTGVAAAMAALALWVAEALEYFPGGREAAQSRYQYTASTLTLLASAALIGRRRMPRWSRWGLALVTLAICVSNVAMLRDRAGFWGEDSRYDRAELGALELARNQVQADFMPENAFTIALAGNHNLTAVNAGPYFDVVKSYGSPAYTPQQILAAPDVVRRAADLVLVQAEAIAPKPGAVALAGRWSCRKVTKAGSLTLTAASGAAQVRVGRGAPAQLGLTRFGSAARLRWRFAPAAIAVLRLPRDRSTLPWRLTVFGPAGTTICRSTAGSRGGSPR